ncbi:MAG TPA: hypothetical protein VGW40_07095 [Allosphingosinicella sp.]|nr:hypothetical protein [Allosphingosinicella sp.]
MRHVPFDPNKSLNPAQKAWWKRWSARAARERARLISKLALGEPAVFNGSIWADLKKWLLEHVFHGKCAYCETRISAGFFGDGEHYRPKGNVTVKSPDGERVAVAAAGKSHPGYYWLAYEWQNLLPACELCNNAKLDQFPVGTTHVHVADPPPDVLDKAEEPLLINPYFEDANAFLGFDEFGVVYAIKDNPRGQATINVFGLDRPKLKDDRWLAQQQAIYGLGPSVLNLLTGTSPGAVDLWVGPRAQYSQAVLAYAKTRSRLMFQELWALMNPESAPGAPAPATEATDSGSA